jgi:hypothetical protein
MAVNWKQYFNSLTNGDLVGKDSFYKDAGDVSPQVQESVKYEKAKGVEGHYVSGNYVEAQRDFTGTNNEDHWAKFAARSSDITESFPQIIYGKTASLRAAFINFSDSYIKCYNGNGAGGGTWVSTGVAVSNDEWYIIKVKIDFAAKTWDCWVDDMETPKLTGLGFFNNGADSFNWLSFYLAYSSYPDAKYIDTMSINSYDPDFIWDGINIGFNSGEGYSVGNLLGQNDWSIGSTNWKVTDLVKYEGDQSARSNAGTAFCAIPDLQGEGGDASDYYGEAVLRSDDVSESNDHPQWGLGYIISKFASRMAIFNGKVWAYDGSIPGYVDTGYAPIDSEWVRCKVLLRYADGVSTYDVWVDDMVTPKLTGLQFESTVDEGNLFLQVLRIGVLDVTFWGYVDDIKIYKPIEAGRSFLSQGFNTNLLLSGRFN